MKRKGIDTVLIIDEGAEEVRAWAAAKGLTGVGQMPMLERKAGEVRSSTTFDVRIAAPDEVGIGSRLAASAFALDEEASNIALAQGALEIEGNDLWPAKDEDGPVGCGIRSRAMNAHPAENWAPRGSFQNANALRAIREKAGAVL